MNMYEFTFIDYPGGIVDKWTQQIAAKSLDEAMIKASKIGNVCGFKKV